MAVAAPQETAGASVQRGEAKKLIGALLIAEAANPEWASVPLEGWSHSRAIAGLTRSHTVTQIRNQAAFERAGITPAEFTPINSEKVAKPLYRVGTMLRGGKNKGWTTVTAFQALAYPYFERVVWKTMESRLRAGEFQVVHRLTPLSPTMPSMIAARVRRLGIPFVIGPLNGGVPWPAAFDSARRREKEWLSYVRGAYKLLPGYRSTRRWASAIICGSRATLEQMPTWCRERCVYIPENAVDPARFPAPPAKDPSGPMRVAFVGRLVPYKGADMLLEAAAGLVKAGRAVVDIIGDGPMAAELKEMARREGIEHGVTFAGWVPHTQLHERLSRSQVFGFPSVREFGGAVVLEAMALGLAPVILDYGGPGELVTPKTGVALPMGTRAEVVERVRRALTELSEEPARVAAMGEAGRRRVVKDFTWEAKARQVVEVYRWVLGEREKPDFGMPLPD